MSWLLAAQSDASATASSRSTSSSGASSSSGTDPLQDLFAQIDGNGDGQISRSEFEAVLGAGGTNVAKADKVFGELDGNGDGSVSPDEMKWALKAGHRPQHHHGAVASATDGANASTSAESASNADALLQAMSSATQINSDGSTTTTQTNLESSAVKTTKAAASSAVQNASAHYHLAQLQHNRQIQASTVAGSSTALSV
jgi:Ca2+-binding EF-hand superfamily protein